MSINALEVVSLDLARLQCSIDTDDLDPLLQHYIETALDYCLNRIDDPKFDTVEKLPKQVKQAMLLLIGEWVKNREASDSASQEIPFGVENLIMQCRNWYGAELPEA